MSRSSFNTYSSSSMSVGTAIILLILLFVVAYGVGSSSCTSKAKLMKMEHDFGPFQGCMLKTKNGWRPIETLREIDP